MEEYIAGLRGTLALNLSSIGQSGGKAVTFVVGNESCDLDSAVSAIVFAYFLHTREILKERIIVPLLNVPEHDLALKTEVLFCLKQTKLAAADIPLLEEITFSSLKKLNLLSLVLVDHHVLFDESLQECLTEVIDHRPVTQQFHQDVKVTIKPVGSCATLVLKRIWEVNPDFKVRI